jgi:pyrroline-5-carboxylate reductase
MIPPHVPVVFIGGGTMARAIIHGAIEAKVLDSRSVALAEPQHDQRAMLQSWVGFASRGIADAMTWLAQAEESPGQGQILLAVKPQSLPEVAAQLRPVLGPPSRVVISILAGATSHSVRTQLGDARVIRVMPNMPAQIGKGMTAVARGAGSVPGDEHLAERIFGGVGRTISTTESMMDAFTALAGSGPAYVFYLAEAMLQAAEELGFDHADALTIVRETIAGAGALLARATAEPTALRAAVTSKGGTTAAALTVLEAAGVNPAIRRAITAARDRGAELGRV